MSIPLSPVKSNLDLPPAVVTPDKARMAAVTLGGRLKAGPLTPVSALALNALETAKENATPRTQKQIQKRVRDVVRNTLGVGSPARMRAAAAAPTLDALLNKVGTDVGPYFDRKHVGKRHARVPAGTDEHTSTQKGRKMRRLHKKATTFFESELTGAAAQAMAHSSERLATQGIRVLYKHETDERYFVGIQHVAPATYHTLYPIFYVESYDPSKMYSILADGSLILTAADVKLHIETLITTYTCAGDPKKNKNPIKFCTSDEYWVDIASAIPQATFPFPTGIYFRIEKAELSHVPDIAIKAAWA